MSKSQILNKAKLAKAGLTMSKRNEDTIITVRDDAPEWVTDLCRDAHGTMLPDDFIFATIAECLDAIIEADGDTDSIELEADIYNGQLTTWLSSSNIRIGYVDDAMEQNGLGGLGSGIIEMIQAGQHLEKTEILSCVVSSLENLDLEEKDE